METKTRYIITSKDFERLRSLYKKPSRANDEPVDFDSLEYLRATEVRQINQDAATEMVLAYVPEASEMWFSDALRLAYERDAEAAETLRLDCTV